MCYKLFGEAKLGFCSFNIHKFSLEPKEKPKKNIHKNNIYVCEGMYVCVCVWVSLCVCVCVSICLCVCPRLTNLCWRFVICFSHTLCLPLPLGCTPLPLALDPAL